MSGPPVPLLIPVILKRLDIILLINKNLMDSFALVSGEVALRGAQNWKRSFSLLQKKKKNRSKQTKAGKQNPPKVAESGYSTHNQSVNHCSLEAKNSVKHEMLQSLINSGQSLTNLCLFSNIVHVNNVARNGVSLCKTLQTEAKNGICPREVRLYLEKADGKCRNRGTKAAEGSRSSSAAQESNLSNICLMTSASEFIVSSSPCPACKVTCKCL